MAREYDIRPEGHRYRKRYADLSRETKRRYRRVVDPRPLSERLRDPIDKKPRVQREQIIQNRPRPRIEPRQRIPAPRIGRKRGYTKRELYNLPRQPKDTFIVSYYQYYAPHLDKAQDRSPQLDPNQTQEDARNDEYDALAALEEQQVDLADEEVQDRMFYMGGTSYYGGIGEAIDSEYEAQAAHYSAGGQVHRAIPVRQVFFFVKNSQA